MIHHSPKTMNEIIEQPVFTVKTETEQFIDDHSILLFILMIGVGIIVANWLALPFKIGRIADALEEISRKMK